MTNDKESPDRRSPRITDQFRKDNAMFYDFRCDQDRLTISIAPRASQDDEGEWRVQAWTGRSAETDGVTEWGPTRAEALSAVGRSWDSCRVERSLPSFDWDAIASALGAVRAL